MHFDKQSLDFEGKKLGPEAMENPNVPSNTISIHAPGLSGVETSGAMRGWITSHRRRHSEQ
jgi:hypothetical protein